MSIRVVLVDDQELTRTGLQMVLESHPEVRVVGVAADGQEALDLLDDVAAEVVLMDIRMPVMDGVEATRRITAAGGPSTLILTTFDTDEYVFDALKAGASGFLVKDTPVEELVAAIVHIHHGDAVVAPSATRRLVDRYARRGGGDAPPPASPMTDSPALQALTTREGEVLAMVARGLSNAEIAADLVVSEGTIKTHVGRILTKLDLRDRVQAVVFAYENGVVSSG